MTKLVINLPHATAAQLADATITIEEGGVTPPHRPLVYGYYGTMSPDIDQIKDHVNFVHIGAWGNWDTQPGRDAIIDNAISLGLQAVAAGLVHHMYTLDFCCFTSGSPKHMLPLDTSRGYLDHFFTRLRDVGLTQYTEMFYVIDEPNISENNLSAQDIDSTINWIKAVAGFYWNPAALPKMCIVYGWNSGPFPGIGALDYAGFDNYGANIFHNGMYQHLKNQLSPTQKSIVVPGGADPWRENPMPFYDFALANAEVGMIFPFKWFSDAGTSNGINDNGMAAQYVATGKLATGMP